MVLAISNSFCCFLSNISPRTEFQTHSLLLLVHYHERWLSPCRKKLQGADDDEGCLTGVGRQAGAGAGLEQEQGRSRNRIGAGKEQG